MRIRPRHSGFTLAEVMVALTVILVILGVLYASYSAASTSVARCRWRADRTHGVRGVLRQMSRELRCAHLSPRRRTSPSDVPSGTLVVDEEEEAWFEGKRAASGGRFLRLVTTSGIGGPGRPPAGLSVVAYRLDPLKEVLFRSEMPLCCLGWQKAEAHATPILRNVRSVALEYSDGKDWHDRWDSNDDKRLPGAVRVTVVLGDGRTYAGAAWIACQAGRVADAGPDRSGESK